MAPLKGQEPVLPADRALVFVGFMGAGKTTAARRLAKRFGVPVHDADAAIAEHAGMPIDRCFGELGESGFRALEERLVGEALEQTQGGIYSLGGGALHSARIRAALRRHTTVLLDVDVNTAWERAAGRGRPLARDPQEFRDLYIRRRPMYMAAADVVIPADRRDRIDDALPSILALHDAPHGTRLLWATSTSGDYPVFVGRDLLGAALSPVPGNGYLVTDDQVGPRYAQRLGDSLETITIPAGETHKTLQTAESVWIALGERGMTQSDHLVALGGGVVGDLAGFVAATYQRGVPIVQVPTTLVSQVDSAYGGKTGVDLPSAKNYVGAYHQPSSVVVDVDTLATLPREEAAAGYAEVVKTALIAGGHLWERVRSGDEPDADMIFECARTKLAVVSLDERDGGVRQVLNLGHTVGHAIETVTRYAMFRHGEAVGLGLLAALRLSGQEALRDEVAALLAAQGLPIQLTPGAVDVDAVVLATARDKKRRSGAPVPFVLLDAPGAARPGCQVGDDDLRAAVAELAQRRGATA
ncbi:bifunctional shikimate kinase/3-dehydroquinate synthase [Conexibacter stalactiti]|uniref:Shikimate kinase n=1 Tax=Conexibacter stalactiti TaxID=1940611 RepID=A0ABU4HMZ2_9ACTN|nr:bifunctional shikimate kinase/3-dehydroquinate synthase [Conexibacter stalactiti]MDW5594681.1 bifunctional shikimate kinase/3-dehydroquinate synthase [Conexibacter stalactiti]MEC5035323.1 bifunctional shikimate kinase/3-dehydroquinate synthase [Conexibacter stalactiti]